MNSLHCEQMSESPPGLSCSMPYSLIALLNKVGVDDWF